MVRPLLTIGIPTYNQPDELARLLDSIESQWTEEVEVLIKDDSENDLSKEVVELFEKKFPINYERGKKEGLDKAILFLTQKAKGKYVWWLGDDSLALGAVDAVLGIVRNYPDTSFVFLNSLEENVTQPTYNIGPDRFFKDKNEVLKLIDGGLGFISATIIERERAIKAFVEAESTVGTAWTCLFLVLYVISDGGDLYYMGRPYLYTFHRDPSKPVWYDGFKVFAINYFKVIRMFDDRFSKEAISTILSDMMRKTWRGIFVYRAKGYEHGLGSREPKIRLLLPLYWNYLEFWKGLPFILMPRFITRPLYNIYIFWKSKK